MGKLFAAIWIASLTSMAAYGFCGMGTLLWLGQHPTRTQAERASYALLTLILLLVVVSVMWFAGRTSALTGQVRYGWVVVFAMWQVLLGLVAAFVTLVALNQ